MSKSLIVATLSVLLSVNVLSPITYATGELGDNPNAVSSKNDLISNDGEISTELNENNVSLWREWNGSEGSSTIDEWSTNNPALQASQRGDGDLSENNQEATPKILGDDQNSDDNENQEDFTDIQNVQPVDADDALDAQSEPKSMMSPLMLPLRAPLKAPSWQYVTLVDGQTFHSILEYLAWDLTKITAIKKWNPDTIPDDAEDISEEGNGGVVIWYDNGTIYYAWWKWVLNPDCYGMFWGLTNLKTIEWIESWDVSNVETMEDMFHGCESIESLDLSSWNVSDSLWNIKAMFTECKSMKSVKLPDFSSAYIYSMSHMFHQNFALTSIDGLNTIDTSNVDTMRHMFSRASSIEEIDISQWNTSSVTDMDAMFKDCTNLKTIYVWYDFIAGATTSIDMFKNSSKLVWWFGTKYDSSKVDIEYAYIDDGRQKWYFTEKGMTYVVFHNHRKFWWGIYDIRPVEIWNTLNQEDRDLGEQEGHDFLWWYDNPELSWDPFDFSTPITKKVNLYQSWSNISLDTAMLLKWADFKSKIWELTDVSNINYIKRSNQYPSVMEYVILSTEDTIPVYAWYDTSDKTLYYYSASDKIYLNENSSQMFQNFKNLTSIDMSGWDTSKVTNMEHMFSACNSLVSLDVSWWDTSLVKQMWNVFRDCWKLKEIKWIENWNTINVTKTAFMFLNCNSLKEIDLSWWDTNNVSEMQQMFARNNEAADGREYQLQTIYVWSWFVTNKASTTQMFWRAKQLVWWNWTTWLSLANGTNWVWKNYAKIDMDWQKWLFTDASLPRVTFYTKWAQQVIASKAVQVWWKVTDPMENLTSVWWIFTYQWYVAGTDEERDFDNDTVSESMTLYAWWDCRAGYVLNDDKVCEIDTQWDRDRQVVNDLDVYFIDSSSNVYHDTLMDRNMWATAVYTWEVNPDTYGYYYQWWNNYGFRYDELNNGDTPKSSTQVPYIVWSKYAPSTYATWMLVMHKDNWQGWWTSDSNLRWWAGDSLSKDWVWTKADRQWPCPDGYYVPSAKDLNSLLNEWKNIAQDSNDYEEFAKDLTFPLAWHVKKEDWSYMGEGDWYLWSSTPARNDGSYRFAFNAGQFDIWGGMQRSSGDPIRCFKNVDNTSLTVYPNGWVKAMITVLDSKLRSLWTPTRGSDEFLWWYTTPNFLRWAEIFEWDSMNWVSVLYARWEGDEESYVITFVNEDGIELQKIEVSSGSLPSYPGGLPTKADDNDYTYTFAWWSPEISDATWDATYTAIYTAHQKSKWWSKSSGWVGNGWNSDPDTHGSADERPEDDTHVIPLDSEGEEFNVHKWAYENWLTKYANVMDARFDDPLNRAEMAKISSIFDVNFLWKTPDESKKSVCSQYPDIKKLWDDLHYFVVQSCELWNMWYQYDNVDYISEFMPYDSVNIAQASIILSRLARWKKYIISPEMWYQWHLYAVYDNSLLDDASNPWRFITRREAFTAFYRLDKMLKENK